MYIAILFKKFYDVEGKDLHDAPSYMKDLVKYTFIDLEQFEDKYSQANIGEMYHFVRRFLAKAPVNSKVKDMKTEHPLLMGLKVTFYVNSLLYFAITMNEKRFPFGSTYYEYVSFLTHQFYIILKGLLSEKDRAKHIRLFGTICNLYDYTTLIYLFEHNPELAPEIVYLLSNSNSNTLRKEERNLIVEYLENKIFVNKEDKASLFQILQPKT